MSASEADLTPLESLYDGAEGNQLPLPETLARLYGDLRFPKQPSPHVIANFVETLDGVVALTDSGKAGGGPISGNNQHDRMVMGLLRAAVDAVIVAAGTARLAPGHVWSAEHIFPDLTDEYHRLSTSLGKPKRPLNVIVTSSGTIDATNRVFASGDVPVLIVTSERGAAKIERKALPSTVAVRALTKDGALSASAIVEATRDASGGDRFLLEGGPQLMSAFFDERLIDELFLTLAPQVAGRGDGERPGFVEGKTFAPDDPRWGELLSVKRGGEHLFLRYSFASDI
jgi:riboflavin biosynthesis pyrimidine reductase